MRILLLNTDYQRFQAWFYGRHAGLELESYATQVAKRDASLFGLSDFYPKNFAAHGHVAQQIYVSTVWMQAAWAREHGLPFEAPAELSTAERRTLPGWAERAAAPFKQRLRPLARRLGFSPSLDKQSENVLLAQIEEFKPDVLINQDVFYADFRLMRRIKGIGKPMLVGQIGVAPTLGEDWPVYDLMISQLPSTVQFFRSLGVRSELHHLAFEPSLLDALPPAPEPDVDVSFVGSISTDHLLRIKLLESIAERYELRLWGNRPQALPASSPLRRCFQGEVWGVDMYQVLRRSRITLNSHIDFARNEAGNMRLFEATGVGTFLLTDYKDNLHTLFDETREVAAWRSIEDCVAAIEHYLRDSKSRAGIARAGQQRTMASHTYRLRTAELLALFETIRPRP
ncbi:glycosyltransferase [Bradyrhizobium sp. ISRA442]|uniref:CgeB family protein n=1 Tax=Bradyrhizobium sp. ISRA442 TaxID=2866197 RepID=UPI00311B0889